MNVNKSCFCAYALNPRSRKCCVIHRFWYIYVLDSKHVASNTRPSRSLPLLLSDKHDRTQASIQLSDDNCYPCTRDITSWFKIKIIKGFVFFGISWLTRQMVCAFYSGKCIQLYLDTNYRENRLWRKQNCVISSVNGRNYIHFHVQKVEAT